MPVKLSKMAIDLGVVTANGPALLAFYRDLLGFRQEPDMPFPMGGVMHRLCCGESLIKIVVPDPAPENFPKKGAIENATGYRYWTMTVDNLNDIMEACDAYGAQILVPAREIRAGVIIGIAADPDGNLVEFVEHT